MESVATSLHSFPYLVLVYSPKTHELVASSYSMLHKLSYRQRCQQRQDTLRELCEGMQISEAEPRNIEVGIRDRFQFKNLNGGAALVAPPLHPVRRTPRARAQWHKTTTLSPFPSRTRASGREQAPRMFRRKLSARPLRGSERGRVRTGGRAYLTPSS